MLNSRSSSRSPFTATQWQELEHQALIYKYMVSGVPIPPELVYSVKRSLESSLASRFFPSHPFGWGNLQVGFGRKPDPEPGRCRRTDGKKWRCSKEAYPDSKYCEKHMHRGRNRSRKPVEQLSSTSSNASLSSPSSAVTTSPSTSSYSFSQLSSTSMEPDHGLGSLINSFYYNASSETRPPAAGFLSQTGSSHALFSNSTVSSSQSDKDYRYYHGMRESMDERAFFPDSTGRESSFPDSSYNHMTMSSYKGYPQTQFSCLGDSPKAQYEDPDNCYPLGSDFKLQTSRSIRLEKDDDTQKPMHQFFGDQWTTKTSSGSWLDLASSTTRTIPTDG